MWLARLGEPQSLGQGRGSVPCAINRCSDAQPGLGRLRCSRRSCAGEVEVVQRSFRHALSSGGPSSQSSSYRRQELAADKTFGQRSQAADDRCRERAIEDQGSSEGPSCTDLSDWACRATGRWATGWRSGPESGSAGKGRECAPGVCGLRLWASQNRARSVTKARKAGRVQEGWTSRKSIERKQCSTRQEIEQLCHFVCASRLAPFSRA